MICANLLISLLALGSAAAAVAHDAGVRNNKYGVDNSHREEHDYDANNSDSSMERRAGPAGVLAGGAASEVIKQVFNAAKDSLNANKHDDWANRGTMVKAYLKEHLIKLPHRNVFIYHQFHGDFKWNVPPSSDPIREQFQVKRKDVPDTTEYYMMVSFDGPGWIERASGADGGYLNWGYWGNITETDNGGRRKVFSDIADPNSLSRALLA